MRKLLLFLLAIAVFSIAKAQVTVSGGTTAAGPYTTIADAITAINGTAFTAAVTVNVNAGHTETAPVGGILIGSATLNASLSSTNTLTIQKSGVGANPKITAFVGTSTTVDGIVKLVGADYVTIDAIDLEDPASNTTATQQMEWGYALVKLQNTAPFDGCQNNTIKNCTITLSLATNGNTYGIYAGNHIATSTTGLTITAVSDANSNNKFQSNTITAYSGFRMAGFGASSPYTLYDQGNEIGGVGVGNTILNHGGGSSTPYGGMYAVAQNNLKFNNNSVSGGSGTTTTHYGVFLANSSINSNIEINNNTFDLTNNSTTSQVSGVTASTGTTVGTSNTISISGNTFTINRPSATTGVTYFIYSTNNYPFIWNITNNNIGGAGSVLSGTGATYGYYNISNTQTVNITGNTFQNIQRTAASTSGFAAIADISGSPTNTFTVANNVIRNLTYNTSSTTGLGMISCSASPSYVINNNEIYNISNTHASATVCGIHVASGPNSVRVFNNFISDLKAPNATGANAVRGISFATTTASSNLYVDFNSVYLDGTSSGSGFGSSGLFHTYSATATSAALYLRNNIIVNNTTPTGSGIAVAFRRSASTSLNNINTVRNNCFFAGTASANNLIYYDGTNSDQTIANYAARLGALEEGSLRELPPFINVGTTPYNLHINTATPTQIEGGGIPVTTPVSITTDFDNDTRNVTTPDMGADEFNGISADLSAPGISYTNLIQTCATSDRLFTATITDASGVPTSGALRPKVYYKKGIGGTWFSNSGTLASGTGTNGTWNFTIVAADMGGLTQADVVYYYVIAQDIAGTPNIGSTPSTGLVATDVNTVTTPPTTPNNYTIAYSLSGVYTVNSAAATTFPGGTNFQTFFDLATALNNNCLGGAVTVNVDAASGPYNQQLLLNEISGSSATNTITINGNGRTLSYLAINSDERGIIKLNGTDYVTINNLNITATGTTTSEYGFGVHMLNDADNNTINGCTININTSSTSSTNYAGVVINSIATAVTTAGDSKCDNNVISNNTIIGGYYGVALVANGSTFEINSNQVINNTIQDFYQYGVYANGNNGLLIQGNDLSRPTRTSITTCNNIYFTGNSRNCLISRNKMHDPFNAITATNTTAAYGINFSSCDATAGNENTIANNVIYSFKGNGANLTNGVQNGILNTGSDYTRYYFNSILLDDATATGGATRGFYQTTAAAGIDFKNNIVVISRGGTGDKQCVFYNTAASAITADNNLYYITSTGGTINAIGYYHTPATSHNTIQAWVAASGQDVNSISANPSFTSSTNLTPTSGNDLIGTAITGITTDHIGTTRLNPPAMGAYEVSIPGIWKGTGTSDWGTASNWRDNTVPIAGNSIYIPGTGTMPLATGISPNFNRLIIQSGGSITRDPGVTVFTGNVINNGSITGNGSIELAGTSASTMFGNGSYSSLTINSSGGVAISALAGNKVNITKLFTSSFGSFTTNNNLILKSTSVTNTAQVAAVDGTITGNVQVERFIPSGRRAYRMLAPGVTTTTFIRDNWQEGANNTAFSPWPASNNNPNPGYGTHITGSTTGLNGFDATLLGNPSLQIWNTAGNAWAYPANTNATVLEAKKGYAILIRGDRSSDLNTNTANGSTTLRALGALSTGAVTFTGGDLSSNATGFSLIGNPYWAQVDWEAVGKTNVSNTYWIFDPQVGVRGAYTSYTTGGATSGGGAINRFLQPGQAIFVQNTSAAPTLNFTEANKNISGTLTSTFRTKTDGKFIVKLTTPALQSEGRIADASTIYFGSDFTAAAGVEDASKFTNPDEMIAFNTTNKLLGVDARPLPEGKDTAFLNLSQYRSNNYVMEIEGKEFSSDAQYLEAWLVDSYKNTRTAISKDGKTTYAYTTDGNAASTAAGRFYIVFDNKKVVLPISTNILEVKLTPNPATEYVQVNYSARDKGKTTIRIIGSNGQTITTVNLGDQQNGQYRVPVSRLASGIYTVEVIVGNDKQTAKLVKQ